LLCGRIGFLNQPERKLQPIDRGNRQHDEEQRDLEHEQAAVIGADQRRHVAHALPTVDDAGRQHGRDTDDA